MQLQFPEKQSPSAVPPVHGEEPQVHGWLQSARLHALAEDSGALIVRWLPDGTKKFVNTAYCKHHQKTPDECLATKMPEALSEDWQEIEAKLQKLSSSNPVVTYEEKMGSTKRRSARWVKWTHRGFFDNHGGLIEIQTIGIDITDRRSVESSFAHISHGLINIRGEHYFEHLATHMANVLGADFTCVGRFCPSTKRIHALAALDETTLLKDFSYDLEGTPCEKAMVESVVVHQSDVQSHYPNCTLLRDIGAQSYIGVAMRDDEGRLLGIASVIYKRPISGVTLKQSLVSLCAAIGSTELMHIRDIQRSQVLEQQLRQSQKMEAIGRLAGGVAHDFNNLLTIIFGHSAILQQANLPPLARESAGEIMEAADRAAALTSQLLAFSRKQVMIFRDHDLNKIVNSISRLVGRVLGERVTLDFKLEDYLPLVHADSGMIEQVIMNLLVNARDAMPTGGRIVVSTSKLVGRRNDDPANPLELWVVLSVADSGVGIAPENLEKIFEPFFTTKSAGDGTGLGLATVFGIVEQHRGYVQVASTPAKGTTFSIHFPAVTTLCAPTVAPPVSQGIQRGRGETIVVVEDEEILRKLARNILENFGYKVIEANNANDVLLYSDEVLENIDLLFTDIMMPEAISGWDVARQLRTRKPSLPVVFTSGYDLKYVGSELPPEPGNAYLQKPYQTERLATIVRETLDANQQVKA